MSKAGGRVPSPGPREAGLTALAWVLRGAVGLVIVLGGAALIVPAAGWGMLAVLVLGSVVRVGWLCGRWWRSGDRRFALTAALLLVVLAAGTAGSLLA